MMEASKGVAGIGLGGMMFLIFLTLKLTGHIDWSWVWVTAPLWIGFALWFVIFMIAFVILWRTDS